MKCNNCGSNNTEIGLFYSNLKDKETLLHIGLFCKACRFSKVEECNDNSSIWNRYKTIKL